MKNFAIFLFIILCGENVLAYNYGNLVDSIKVGDFAFGGIVFFVDSTGQHGLVCAKDDQIRGIYWFERSRKDIKTGFSNNTNNKIGAPLADELSINDNQSLLLSFSVCADYSVRQDGVIYDDWSLPTKEELYFVYQNKDIIDETAIANMGSAFVINNELSPTEYCNSPSWDQVFNYGYRNYDYHNSLFNVRAIRAF